MLVFLDFDGVLHPKGRDVEVFCRVALLWKILRACPGVDVVFSTSWKDSYRREELLDFVTYGGGEDLAGRFIGMIPTIGNGDRRDLEIESWLVANGYSGQWIALDDQPELFCRNPNLHVVAGKHGLTEEDVQTIIRKVETIIGRYGNVKCFIQDEYAAQKDKNRRQFGDLVKQGLAKATDASMFHGLARNSKVTYRNEDFDMGLNMEKTLLFLDCEFTDFIDCELLSIGMVSEDGQHEFYAERTDYNDSWCNNFVREGVLPLLGQFPGAACTRDELTKRVWEWFATLPRHVQLASDSAHDRDLLWDAFGEGLPVNLDQKVFDLRSLLDTAVFNDAVCHYHAQPNQPWHHALHDAKAHRAGWLATQAK